ncbi:hypothetical protein WA026_019517 [Henosepilachna vigintioctopunctata]|uniref:Uncharacterized protein n=1 Tax=Henosepilachna vigintioctopunctata TaxID=420089 RepID=A0AAW1TX65_9CUCU
MQKIFYSKTSLRKHAAKCLKTDKRERNIMVMGRRVRSDIHPDACTVMKNSIFPFMRHDKIITLIEYDELVIKFFNEQCLKYRSQHHHKMIRSQLRLMARFYDKFIVATNSLVEHFSSVFCPKNFEKVLEAISSLGQYDENSNIITEPNVPLFIGTLLKKMAKFYKSLFILNEDSLGQKNAENFLSLIDTHFNPHIGQTVLESKLYFSRQKKQDIPTDEDILKFLFYLLRNIKLRFDTLSRTYSYKNWLELAAFCLMWIISFNRRRVGEVERMKIIDFKNYQRVDKYADKDIYNALSLEGKQAVEDFIRIQLRGKLGRTVPLLLCRIVFSNISLILDPRKDANVPDENPYVFGLPGKEREDHIEACPLLREHSEKCGAKNPHLLRGTKLRKHIATKSVMLNLNDQEVSDLANYMGHNERIHKSHYRLPIVAREISEISKILLKAQGVEHSQLNMFLGMHTSREQALEESFAEMNLDIFENAAHSTPYIAKRNKTASMLLPTDKKVPWNSNEKEVVCNHFKSHISMGRTPKLQECFDAIDKCGDILQERSPQAIKSWVNNKIEETDLVMKNRICVRKRWTSPERMTLVEYFRENYDRKTIPTLRKCQDAIDKFIILKDRTPAVIRAKINNDLKKAKRTSVENS